MKLFLADEAATADFGAQLYQALTPGCLIYLRGNLGAGKTTVVRGCLRAAGYRGPVKSPTFTLVEEYHSNGRTIYHFDLYRLADAEELEWMGIRDYIEPDAICFVEWPERGEGVLPLADLDLSMLIEGASARTVEVKALTAAGRAILEGLGRG